MSIQLIAFIRFISAIACVLLLLSGCQSTGKDGKPLTQAEILQKRQATLQMAKTGLDALIKQNPKVKEDIEKAPG
jgi:outer membrane murein-binding lipoprotein Lpp